jgi:hypothetical protein
MQIATLRQPDSSVGVISHGDCGSSWTIQVDDFSGVETERIFSGGILAGTGSPSEALMGGVDRNRELQEFVKTQLTCEGWTPEQILGYL